MDRESSTLSIVSEIIAASIMLTGTGSVFLQINVG